MDTDKPFNPIASAWQPVTDPIELAHLGKLAEELAECGAAVSRCIIQGVNASEPETGKLNHKWLTDEIADVLANINLVIDHYGLSRGVIKARVDAKTLHLQSWHTLLKNAFAQLGQQTQ